MIHMHFWCVWENLYLLLFHSTWGLCQSPQQLTVFFLHDAWTERQSDSVRNRNHQKGNLHFHVQLTKAVQGCKKVETSNMQLYAYALWHGTFPRLFSQAYVSDLPYPKADVFHESVRYLRRCLHTYPLRTQPNRFRGQANEPFLGYFSSHWRHVAALYLEKKKSCLSL